MGGGLIVAGKPLPQKATPSGKATPTEVGQSSSLVFPMSTFPPKDQVGCGEPANRILPDLLPSGGVAVIDTHPQICLTCYIC